MTTLNISSFMWGIADDVLRDVYVRSKYRDVILPMTVIRRLDAVLEPTKDAVLRMKEQLDAAGITWFLSKLEAETRDDPASELQWSVPTARSDRAYNWGIRPSPPTPRDTC